VKHQYCCSRIVWRGTRTARRCRFQTTWRGTRAARRQAPLILLF